MTGHPTARALSPKQILGLVALALALFFMFSFASKSVDAYRLRNWRDRLQLELDQMERERQELADELDYRQSATFADAALRQAGLLPTDVVRIVPVTRVVARAATPVPETMPMSITGPQERGVFQNPSWEAWRRLIWRVWKK